MLEVTLPPLRERRDEIPLLIEFFSDEAAEQLRRSPIQMSQHLRERLLSYDYPGNVRELRNIIFRLSCLSDDQADVQHLPDDVGARPESEQASGPRNLSLSAYRRQATCNAERQFLEEGLREANGKVVELARRSGMNRSYLQTLIKKTRHACQGFSRDQPGPSLTTS